jgi:hypothetical protein
VAVGADLSPMPPPPGHVGIQRRAHHPSAGRLIVAQLPPRNPRLDERLRNKVLGELPVTDIQQHDQQSGGTKTVNRGLEEKARSLAGLKGYVTNLAACPDGTPVTAEFVIGAYHQLLQAEKSFRMAKSDLQARPVYHHLRESIEAHLTIVFAALAVSRWIETTTGWSIRRFVKTARRYRTIEIQAGDRLITAADPLPADLSQALSQIHHNGGAH